MNLKRFILVTIGLIAILYLIASFIAWEFNPEKWSVFGRFIAGWAFLTAIAFAGILEDNSK